MAGRHLKSIIALGALVLAGAMGGSPAWAQDADMVLVNGKIVTLDGSSTVAEALAIRDGNIAAVGNEAAVRKLSGTKTRVVDLGGRMIVPGLIDSHIHAIRTALTFGIETDWSSIGSLDEGLKIVADAARARPGAWIVVGGGWHEGQLKEHRGPTAAELAKAAPDNPVYVQHLYDYAVLSPRAMETLTISTDADIPPAGKLVRDANGQPTGVVHGDLATFSKLFARVSTVGFAGRVESTKAFFKAMNRVGLTGIIDAAGGGMPPQNYFPLFHVWQQHALSLRVAYYVNGATPTQEARDLKQFFQGIPANFGDDRLKILGIGEVVVWGMHDGPAGLRKIFTPKPGAVEALREIANWAAERRLRIQIHASSDSAAGQILDVFEEVNGKAPIGDLRWTIAHIENASAQTLNRMKALGIGWAIQDRLYFEGDVWPKVMGAEAAKQAPPIAEGLKAGVVIAGGTDGPRMSPYNPFVTLEWLVTGRTVRGTSLRAKEASATREQALRIHTVNSAWMAGDDDKRGTLEVGKWADLIVLSDDYFAVPENDISRIKVLLTLVGGKVEHAAEPFKRFEKQQ
ncbi:MAG TPA: amidohydrolase [Pseudolabrys sp.]|nr:amidohydrolase [Pseudolabrys sp.]